MSNTIQILKDKELKVTPQRIAILEAIHELKNHPTAENIIEVMKVKCPTISVGTVYKVLDTFVEVGILKKVKTDKEVMRYDHILDKHHHLLNEDGDEIEDFHSEQLDSLLEEFFILNKIKNFEIGNIQLHITGKFIK